MLEREDVVPGMIAAIQTFGTLLHWNPHIHSLVTCGAYTPEGEFLNLPEFDMDRLLVAWQEAVFSLYLSEGKIEPEVVENMRSWDGHRRAAMVDGFSVDQSVLLSAGDRSGIERLVQYMVRCPFSLSRLVKGSSTRPRKMLAKSFPIRKPTTSKQVRNGISRSSRHSTFWPSSLSTFRPKDIIPFDILVFILTSHEEYAGRWKKRQSHRTKVILAPCHLRAVAKLGPCSSSESTRLTPWSVLSVAVK